MVNITEQTTEEKLLFTTTDQSDTCQEFQISKALIRESRVWDEGIRGKVPGKNINDGKETSWLT